MTAKKLVPIVIAAVGILMTGLGIVTLTDMGVPGGTYPGLEPMTLSDAMNVGRSEFVVFVFMSAIGIVTFLLLGFEPLYRRAAKDAVRV